MTRKFIHLRTSSAFSVSEGILTPKQIVSLAKENHQSAVAVTDNCKTMGVIQHYMAAREKGMKPIIGVDLYVEPDVTKFAGADLNKILLIATDNHSYKNLLKLTSRAWLENQSDGKPSIKQSWLEEEPELATGLICLTGSFKDSEIAQKTLEVVNTNKDDVNRKVKYNDLQQTYEFYKKLFGNNLFLEIQRIGYPQEDDIIRAYLQSSKLHNIPIVATNPIEFGKREDFVANEIKICDQNKTTLLDVHRPDYAYPEQYFKTTEEMEQTFKGLEFALDNTYAIAEKCNVDIELFHNYLPPFPVPNNSESEVDYFKRLSWEGFEKRMRKLFPNEEDYQSHYKEYSERLQMELDCIIKMEFPGYFLIVQDFINWSKNNNIPVGPGRGSGAGSLVAYSLGITDIDPIKYHLFFERFLNIERVSMPDFDIDFSREHREKVLDYVREKYGESVVSQIITTINLKPKALLKAVGRTLNAPHNEVETLTKTITNAESLNEKTTVSSLYETNENFRETVNESETLKEIYQYAQNMDTLPKSLGQHAAGVIITSKDLTEFASLYKTSNTPTVIQLDKKYAEMVGLVKFDFLGLQTLDLIANTVKDIYKQTGEELIIEDIDLNDPEVIELFRKGNTFGVFQFEGKGIQRAVQQLQPTVFEDVVAMTALYRPGPMQSGMLDGFIKRKHGEEEVTYPDPEYQHPCLEPILKNTYGLFVYQEQVMQAAQAMSGYSLGGADLLRRAMGKKDLNEMERQKTLFKEGAIKNGIDGDLATKIFDIIEKFAGYGFNKSHSVAYTVLSMQTAYLKTHYPSLFLANVLNGKDKPEERDKAIQDIRKNGIKILAPDINASEYKAISVNNEIVYGFLGIKSVGQDIANFIVKDREQNGEYKSFIDFYNRCFEVVDKRSVEQLIRAGAFNKINPNQNELLLNVEQFNTLALEKRKKIQKDSGLNSQLTGKRKKKTTAKGDKTFEELEWKVAPEPTEADKVKYELMAFGYNLILDPLKGHLEDFNGLKALSTIQDFKDLDTSELKESVPMAFAGVITNIRDHSSGGKFVELVGEASRKENYVLDNAELIKAQLAAEEGFDLEDVNNVEEEDEIDESEKRTHSFFINKDLYLRTKKTIKENAFVVFEGTVSKPKAGNEKYGNSMWINEIYSKEQMEEKLLNEVNVLVDAKNPNQLLHILEKHTGRIPVTLWLPSRENPEELFSSRVDKKYFVNGSPECLAELREVLGKEALALSFKEKMILEQKQFNKFKR